MPMENGPFIEGILAFFYEELMNIATFYWYSIVLMTAIAHPGTYHGTSVLELATGPGANCRRFLKLIGNSPYTGIDISKGMEKRFLKRCGQRENIQFVNTSITEPFDLGRTFDIVFISFAFHGFPYNKQLIIMENAYRHLKSGGRFCIFGYGSFDLSHANPVVRYLFKFIECTHAYNFIKLVLRNMAKQVGFMAYKKWYLLNTPYLRLHAC